MKRKVKKRIRRIVLYFLVLIIVVTVVAPYLWMFISSISTKSDLLKKPMRWFPEKPTFENYAAMLLGTSSRTTDAASQFLSALKNSCIVTFSVTIIALLVGLIAAYAFSRFRFRGRNFLLNATLSTQMVPAVAIIIPMYTIMVTLNLLDTRWSLVITYMAFVLPYLIWLLKGYIDGIPTDLDEAALIDGCSRVQSFFLVVLPVASTGLAATVIFAFILSWNEFFYAVNFTSTTAAKTLPVLITEFSSKFGSNYILTCTAGVLTSLPPVLVALIFQKYIISGLASGAVKG
ncbi:MAG: carbohydrate ABC transporter permease [Lachnospiraceae bacterium]|nr:carbohydrate ABC transporter permease [Lachnospiraceae bacterium]